MIAERKEIIRGVVEMNRRVRRSPVTNVLMAAACLAILLIVTHPTDAQDSGALKPDDGLFPLTRGQVVELQEFLARFGYDTGPINGIVGPETIAAAGSLAGLLEREVARRPSGREIVLSCKIEEGAPQGFESIQIMVDEQRGIAIYNFQLQSVRNFNPIRKSNDAYIDLSMKITMHNDGIVLANNTSGALVINKKDGKFAYSFVTAFPVSNGNWLAFGNTHSGTCARSAFD